MWVRNAGLPLHTDVGFAAVTTPIAHQRWDSLDTRVTYTQNCESYRGTDLPSSEAPMCMLSLEAITCDTLRSSNTDAVSRVNGHWRCSCPEPHTQSISRHVTLNSRREITLLRS